MESGFESGVSVVYIFISRRPNAKQGIHYSQLDKSFINNHLRFEAVVSPIECPSGLRFASFWVNTRISSGVLLDVYDLFRP